MEFWRAGGADLLARDPASIEAEGWDGQVFMDSQSLGADPYVLMGAWAARTDRLRLSTGVTNPMTRHPAVTAAAIASVHAVSGGRATLGIGRGDSALAYLGYAPAPVKRFELAVKRIRHLLNGGALEFGDDGLENKAVSAESLELGVKPSSARLRWLSTELAPVAVDVAATGPRVIDIGARTADRVTFSVGAQPERISWARDRARAAAQSAGQATPSLGAQIVVVCHPRPDDVRDAAARLVAPLARFQVLNGGEPAGPGGAEDAASYTAIKRGYDMTTHSAFDGRKLVEERLDEQFVDRFAIVGTPDQCVQRLHELAQLGVERFIIFGPGFYDDGERGSSLFARAVLPELRTPPSDPRHAAGTRELAGEGATS